MTQMPPWYAREARGWTCEAPDAAVAVDDTAAAAAIASLAAAGVTAGPSGAAALAALRAALTGTGAASRRRDLGLDVPGDAPVAVCLCTEGPLTA